MCGSTNTRQASNQIGFAQRFGLRLLPDLYEAYNPMAYDARNMEVELGILLREAGFGVWQA
jgi:hypothetical protein